MILRILCFVLCFSVFSVISITDLGVTSGQPLWAGGGGGKDASDKSKKPSSSKASKDKKTTTKKTQAERDKERAEAERQKAIRGSLRAIELTSNALERSARNSKLKSILRSPRRVTSLQVGIDTMYDELDGTTHENKPQAIYDQLTGYTKLKTDPELKANAKVLLRAISASRQFGRALEASEAYKKAEKAQDVKEMVKQRVIYDEAREDFHREADKLPRPVRNKLFFKLPRDIK